MTQEAESQRGMPTDSTETCAQRAAEGIEIRRAVISELASLHVTPHGFDRVQFGGVGGQALDGEPGPLAPGVFFTAGHRTRTHRRITASSRSTAWRAGRWSDQFRRCRIRQI